MMFRAMVWSYLVISLAMLATSVYTTRRAKALTGDDYYLFSHTRVLVERPVPARNATDAAIDEAFAEEAEGDDADDGEDPVPGAVMTVEEPLLVLGFLDATGPVIVLGGSVLIFAALYRRRRRSPRPL